MADLFWPGDQRAGQHFTDRMAASLAAAGDRVLAEQRSVTDHPSPTYRGDAGAFVDEVVARARRTLEQTLAQNPEETP